MKIAFFSANIGATLKAIKQEHLRKKKKRISLEHLREKEELLEYYKYYKYYKSNVLLCEFHFTTNNGKMISICDTFGGLISHILNNEYPYDDITNENWNELYTNITSEVDINKLKNIVDDILNDTRNISLEDKFITHMNYNDLNIQVNIEYSKNFYHDVLIIDPETNQPDFTEKKALLPLYSFNNSNDFITYLLTELIKQNSFFKKCSNCNKYFYPRFRSDTIYCDYFSPQDSNKTCKDYCSQYNYTEKVKSDKALGLYQKIYSKLSKRVQRHPDNSEFSQAFEDFKKECKKWKANVKSGKANEKSYIQWLETTTTLFEVNIKSELKEEGEKTLYNTIQTEN